MEARGTALWSRASARLAGSRWLLAASAAAVLGVNAIAGGPFVLGLIAVAGLAAVASIAPRPAPFRPERIPSEAEAGAGGLSAADLAAAVPDPLVVFDRNGSILHANDAARAAFGAIAIGSPVELRFRAPELRDLLRRSTTGGSVSASIDYVERVPLERWYRVVVTPIGRGGLSVLMFRDQSEVRRIDRMRADFIANASHELRTPLASVAGFIETLRGPARNDPAARESFLQIMQNQTARMARLIDDLLSLSRLEMKPYLKPGEMVELKPVVESVIDSLAHLAAESGVVIERDLPVVAVEVAGSRDELFQVFENLLENAIKYGQPGGKVIVRMKQGIESDAETTVTIEDFGPGIPAEHIPRVTERFYRVDVDNSRARKGTGLGLSIVKHILTRHNARLSIRSEVGKGSAFTVHFPPRAKPATPQDR